MQELTFWQLCDIASGLAYREYYISKAEFPNIYLHAVHSLSIIHGNLAGVRP
jgi:hypothetical protein